MKFNEQVTIENYIIKILKERLGYEYVPPEKFALLREYEHEFVIKPLLLAAVKKINGTNDAQAEGVVRAVAQLDSNEKFLAAMRDGVSQLDQETRQMRSYALVDFENPENNDFVITNQFYFEGTTENIRPDVMVFLNGLPVVDIEAKSPTASTGVSYQDAIGQLKRYEKNAPRMFFPNCFNIATDGIQKTVYGATYSPKQYFFEWKDTEKEKELGGALEMTLWALLSKDRLTDIIKNFILFEQTEDAKIKKICRYQQYRATNKIVERVREGKQKLGLIWHTQGSGKSMTMFFAAWKLRFDKDLLNPKVFILVDRIDLDDQLFKTFVNCGGQNVIRVISREDLADKINSNEKGIFISTIQKFNELKLDVVNLDSNIIVFSDEAHRGNEGEAAINLRSAMKNAFFFGFTGTPIDSFPRNTHRNFAQSVERYLDYYSIAQAIDDEATLPVTYEARLSKFFIDEERVDKQFEELTADLNPAEKDFIAKKYGKKDALVKLEKRMRAVIRDIVEHYRAYIEPNGFKAQIVCYDREATAKYKKLLDELMPKEASAVVYSESPNTDTDELAEYVMTPKHRKQVIEEFKKPESAIKFLLVCDMLLTGFDAPVEQVMYLDKPLRDHNLLQAIARTNRVYGDQKGCGRIIDYYGITRSLEDSLNFDESIVQSAMMDIQKVKDEFVQLFVETVAIFAGVNTEDPSIDNLRKCLNIFRNHQDKQEDFAGKYNRLKLLYEILAPDPFLKEYLRKFGWLTSFYIAFTKEFRADGITDPHALEQYGEKVRKLIQSEVDYEGITKNFRELNIHDLALLEKRYGGTEEKAAALEKLLKREISIDLDFNPVFKKFGERLDAIRREFEQHQIDLSERLRKYQQLLEDVKKAGDEARELGYSLKEYALYNASMEYISGDPAKTKDFIQEMTRRFDSLLDFGWQDSSRREELLKEVKRTVQTMVLQEYRESITVKDLQKYLNRLIDIVLRKFIYEEKG